MNVLSLFDGMSCGQIALRELGIKVDNYFASEIDRHAIAQTQLNFPDTTQLGSVTDVRAKDLPKIDLLIGGSLCQGFSFAGKQLNFNDPRSSLFFEYVRILNEIREINPNVIFLLENVRMKREYEDIITDFLGVRPVLINSARVSAQNRVRLYWSNIRTRQIDLFGTMETAIPQPKDLGLFFRDIMEEDAPEKYYLSEKVIANLVSHKERNESNGHGYGMEVRTLDQKSIAIRIGGRGMYDLVAIPDKQTRQDSIGFKRMPNGSIRGYNVNDPKKTGISEFQFTSVESKSPTLTVAHIPKAIIPEPGVLRTHKVDGGFRPIKSGKAGCLCARARQDGSGQGVLRIGERIRRYTPTECSRLQTIPEWYKWQCPETQQYKMLGNGWTVKVIMHIFQYLK